MLDKIGILFVQLWCILIWLIVGGLMWIAVLARCTAIFSAVVFNVALAGGSQASLNRCAKNLKIAISIYSLGFSQIQQSFRNQGNSDEDYADNDGVINWLKLTLEFGWAALFWYMTLATFGRIPWWPFN